MFGITFIRKQKLLSMKTLLKELHEAESKRVIEVTSLNSKIEELTNSMYELVLKNKEAQEEIKKYEGKYDYALTQNILLETQIEMLTPNRDKNGRFEKKIKG